MKNGLVCYRGKVSGFGIFEYPQNAAAIRNAKTCSDRRKSTHRRAQCLGWTAAKLLPVLAGKTTHVVEAVRQRHIGHALRGTPLQSRMYRLHPGVAGVG
jgi:hypothetical protein